MLALYLITALAADSLTSETDLGRAIRIILSTDTPATLSISSEESIAIVGALPEELVASIPAWSSGQKTDHPLPIPVPTETPSSPLTETAQPTEIETLLGSLTELIRTARQRRLGLLESREHTDEKIVTIENPLLGREESFPVPVGTDPLFYQIYSPTLVARNLGILRPDGSIDQERQERLLDEETYTLLVCGTDARQETIDRRTGFASRCDAPIVVRLNFATMQVSLLSLARDIVPPVMDTFHPEQHPDDRSINLMTSYWFTQENNSLIPHQPPLEFARFVTEQAIGIPVDGVQTVSFQAAAELLAILIPNGVSISLPHRVYDPDPTTWYYSGHLDIPAGEQHLGAFTLIDIMRARHETSDYDRQAMQRLIMQAIFQAILQEVKEKDILAKVSYLLPLAHTVSGNLSEYSQNATRVADPTFVTEAATAYAQGYGLDLQTLLTLLQNNLLTLGSTYLSDRLDIPSFSYTTLAITPELTDSTTDDEIGFWGPARTAVSSLFGLPASEPHDDSTSTQETISTVPTTETVVEREVLPVNPEIVPIGIFRTNAEGQKKHRVRSGPGTDHPLMPDPYLQPDTNYTVLSGPYESEGLDWFQVDLGEGKYGYVADVHNNFSPVTSSS